MKRYQGVKVGQGLNGIGLFAGVENLFSFKGLKSLFLKVVLTVMVILGLWADGAMAGDVVIPGTGVLKGTARVEIDAAYTLKNNARNEGGVIVLTDFRWQWQNGQVEYANLQLGDKWGVEGEFSSGWGSGADAFYIYAFANGTSVRHDDNKGQYSIAYNEYADKIQLIYAGSVLKEVAQTNIDNNYWRAFKVICDKGYFQIYLDDQLKLEYDDRANYPNRISGTLFGFGGWAGACTNNHWIKKNTMRWFRLNAGIQETVRLTSNVNGQHGQVEYADLKDNLGDNWRVAGDFWSGGGNGADAFNIYAFEQYSIDYNEWLDKIRLIYAGTVLKEVAQTGIDSSSWRAFKVICNKGYFQIYLDNQLKLEYDDRANYPNRISGTLFGFGGWTGGCNNYHYLGHRNWYRAPLSYVGPDGTGNLLKNPGAEDGFINWGNHNTKFTYWDGGGQPPYSGKGFFFGGVTNDESIGSQYVDVSQYAAEIDNGNVSANFSGWFSSWGGDKGIFELLFWNASFQNIGYHCAGGWQCHTDWKKYYINKLLPPGTRKIEVRMRSVNSVAGTNNDGFFDDLSLNLSFRGMGSNGKVNVAEGESFLYEVVSEGAFYPGATIPAAGYKWKIESDNYGNLSDPKRTYAFSNSGFYDVWCKSSEMLNNKEVWSDELVIPVRVWKRPEVKNTPPQSAIDNSYVSWSDGKYVGVKGEPVYLMADGEKGSTEPAERIIKYIWDFDNNWETVELEQIAGERAFYVWDKSNLNGSIRCKAVTNYGIESNEKVFNLKVYDTMEINTGGPYTGRPNKELEMKCSVNQTAYPVAISNYQWRLSTETTFTLKGDAIDKRTYIEEATITSTGVLKGIAMVEIESGYTLKNNASQHQGYVEFTQPVNWQYGHIEYANLQLGNKWMAEGEFWSGGGSGADAFYIYAFANGAGWTGWHGDSKGQYSITYYEWQNKIQLIYGNTVLKEVAQNGIASSSWRAFKVICDNGEFQIYLDNQLKLEYDDTANYQSRVSGTIFGFGGYTGGANNYHSIRNMKWYHAAAPKDPVLLTPNVNGQSGQVEYSDLKTQLGNDWRVAGDFWSGNGNGADAFYIYAYANGTPVWEEDNKGQYTIAYDEWTDEIQLLYAGNILKKVSQTGIDNSQWRQFQVECKNGVFKIYLDGSLKLEYNDSANYQNRISGTLFGFGARTGGAGNYHYASGNIQWYKRTVQIGEQVDYINLTTNETGKSGQIEYADLQLGNKWSASGEFWSGDGSGADAFYIYAFANETPRYTQENKGQYAIDYHEYQDKIRLIYAGTILKEVAQTGLDNSQWHHFAVTCDQGVFKVYLDYRLRLEYDDRANYSSRISGSLFGFGAFTGAATNYHRIRNMKWSSGTAIATDSDGKAKNTWTESGEYGIEAEAIVTTQEGLVLIDRKNTRVSVESGKPTAMPGGPYRGGIKGGNYSPIQFEGNNPDFVEGTDTGKIVVWEWTLGNEPMGNIWNPTRHFEKAGNYEVSLKVKSEYGKWSSTKTTQVTVIDGKIAGYVRAADLRTPVGSVTLWLTSSHVDKDVLAQIAASDNRLNTTSEGGLRTLTNEKGYYEFAHIPLGNYRIRASKGEGDNAHEFEKTIQVTDLTLDGPNQLAIDFVDISVYPVGGRIVYSIQKNGVDVLVEDVEVKAQPVGNANGIEALPSNRSLSATGVNYSMPLFAGKYLFLAKKGGHVVRIKKGTPGYDPDTQLVTINDARTDIDFIDYTTYKLTVFVEDSGGYPIASQTLTISGDNGQAEGISDEADGKFVVTLNPGKYTVKVPGALPEEKEVDITAGDNSVKMTIPSKIEISISPRPKLFDVPDEFLSQFGLKPEDNPEGYMYYYPPELRKHNYIIKATSKGHPVEGVTLFVRDEVSILTPDPPEEKSSVVEGNEGIYTMTAGLPKMTTDDPPLADTKTITFWAKKDKYLDSDKVSDGVIVLGDVLEGSAAKIISIPTVNYTVLHDPPGDGSYAFLDDSMSIKGIILGMDIKIKDTEIPVYPSPWSKERDIWDGANYGTNTEHGLLGYQDSDSTLGHFVWGAALESLSGAGIVALGPFGFILQLVKIGIKTGALNACDNNTFVQYEVSPNRHLETPSGDELPDLVGPGKGDVYYGEGWTLGLQTKYRLGIERTGTDTNGNAIWALTTNTIETYDILERTNQYIYTIRDIENIIKDLDKTIADITGTDTSSTEQKQKRTNAKNTWQELLNNNLSYVWNKNYLTQGKSFADFKKEKGDKLDDTKMETLIFSAGPSFEYSRTVSQDHTVSYSQEVSVNTDSEFAHELEIETGFKMFGTGVSTKLTFGSTAGFGSNVSFGSSWESGQSTEQSVGFLLNDDDVGDNYSTRVYADPKWGTPIFFTDAGSYSSDPWEKGTNKAVDVTMELVEDIASQKFDYREGADFKIKLKYTGQRELESSGINFLLYAPVSSNKDNLTIRFNGDSGPYRVELSKETPVAEVVVSAYPSEKAKNNSEQMVYSVPIAVSEEADDQVSKEMALSVTFADLRAPRATIVAPYSGQRVSPVFFPQEDPFDIEVVSEDMDLAGIQLQIRSKQPNGVWEPWRNLSGMKWEGTNTAVVTVFDRLDRRPPRREFTFKWSEAEIKMLGVGEYAIRAIATDKATIPNTDIAPPDVVFLVDDAKPSVLTSIPDYQDSDSKRIYRGELSVLFTDDMRATDFSDCTFVVTDLLDNNKKVAGYVSYSPALRKTIFVPIVPFKPNGFYRVVIKTDEKKPDDTIDRGVHDLAGNPLDNAFMWTFRTLDAPFEPTWSIALAAMDGLNKDGNNIAGVEYGASDGTDEKDAPSVPSMASQMRLSYLNNNREEFDRDVRPADGRLSHHWFFVIDNAQRYATVTITFQPSLRLTKTTREYQILRLVEFDKDGNVTNRITLDPTQAVVDVNTGEIIPLFAYEYINQGERSRYFRLDVQRVGFVSEIFKQGSSGWKFFSAPITPQVAEPFVNLGDDIDPFRLYQYETKLGGYKIYPFDIGEVALQTGHSYFTRLDKDVTIDVGGSSNFDDLQIKLNNSGWQAIGNPFILPVNVAELQFRVGTSAEAVSFDQAVTDNLIESTLYRWDVVDKNTAFMNESLKDSYELATNTAKLIPWEGYWLRTKVGSLTLIIPAPEGIGTATPKTPDYLKPPVFRAGKAPTKAQESVLPQFQLCLELFSKSAADRATVLGTYHQSDGGYDAMDSQEPPIMDKTVAGYFEHSSWGKNNGLYNCDYQQAMKPGEQRTWQLTVYTDIPNAPMTLSWEKSVGNVPGDIMLTFRRVGESETAWQDMRQTRKVTLASSPRITEERFEICAKRGEMKASAGTATTLVACYPNPSKQEVWFSYKLAEASDVKIDIYNIVGELVRTLDLGAKPSGSNVDKWDGNNQAGEKVASGIYIYLFKAGNYTKTGKIGICR